MFAGEKWPWHERRRNIYFKIAEEKFLIGIAIHSLVFNLIHHNHDEAVLETGRQTREPVGS